MSSESTSSVAMHTSLGDAPSDAAALERVLWSDENLVPSLLAFCDGAALIETVIQ
jgi:hypothetical protein